MSRFTATFVGAAALVAACSDAPQPAAPDLGSTTPAFSARDAGEAIPDAYIVVFRAGVADPPGLARRLAADHGAAVTHVYEHALKGFAFRGSAQAAEALSRNPNVEFVEADQVMTAIATQTNATWGIDRIDQRDLPLSTTYTYGNTGSGVTAYILDTGILFGHSDFGGRASPGFDAVGTNGVDCNGHGTHVAGTVGGTTWGVAKGVALVAVRVLNCQGSGTTTGVIAGVDWVTGNHQAGAPAVANMSLGGGASSALDQAVANSIADGVTYALAAGNGDFLGRPLDACTQSPARTPAALTVGATTKTDTESSFSNYGSCVDILAPGSGITSAWYTSTTATNTISGTSMATPHVAGAAALYLSANPSATPAAVATALVNGASSGKIALHSRSVSGGTPNRLLFMGDGGSVEPPPPATGISLSVRAYKVKGTRQADLTWSGAVGTNVDVHRNGSVITTTDNDGTHTDNIGGKGGGSFTYRVCNAGTTTCSPDATATF